MMKHLLLIGIAIFNLHVTFSQFTFGTIPDTQNLSENDTIAAKITETTQWYVEHKDSLNIKFVASLGDMTQWGAPDQYVRIKKSYEELKSAEIPFAPCQGNHDSDLVDFDKVFPVSEFEPTSTFGGYFEGMHNAYYLFSDAGINYIVVVIRTHDNHVGSYDLKSITWANEILKKHATRRAIFVTHDFFENKALINDVIKKHDNIILAVCGHSCAREKYWTELSPSGNKIHCIMTDYQCDSNKGATLRYYTFKPAENKVYAYTYNITKHEYETDENSQFSFKAQITTPEEPVIQTVNSFPELPKATDSVKITAIITDNGSIISATLNWRLSNSYHENVIKMTANGSEYSAVIPFNKDGSTIIYSITACDNDRNLTNSLHYKYVVEDLKPEKNANNNGRKNEFLLQSVLWYQQAGEVQALYYQAYNFAKLSLDEILKTIDNKKKKAVVVDIDETLLNNSPLYGQSIISDTAAGGKEWKNWIDKASADTLPGALDFLKYASSKGIEVFYISNRSTRDVTATLVNLRKFEFPNADEQHMLFMSNNNGSKEDRRNSVAANYEILLLCGDNLGDFSFVFENRELKSITDSVRKNKNEFGKRFIVLPNPMYGSWEHTVYGNSNKQKDSIRYSKVTGY